MTLQAIFIRAREQRRVESTGLTSGLTSSSVTYFRIECHGPLKTQHVWRRYNEFVKLDKDLVEQCQDHRQPPGGALPPKSKPIFSTLRRTSGTAHSSGGGGGGLDEFLEERQAALERYLRAILASPDDRWRRTLAWRQFLQLEGQEDGTMNRSKDGELGNTAGPSSISNSAAWTTEYKTLMVLARTIRIQLTKRGQTQTTGPANTAVTSAQIGHALMNLGTRINLLHTTLEILATRESLSQAELDRRVECCERLSSDRENLISSAAQIARDQRITATSTTLTADERRQELLGNSDPQAGAVAHSKGRVLGRASTRPVHESSITKAIPTNGLLDLQTSLMKEQDQSLDVLGAIVARQKQLGLAIQQEVASQNELLDNLTLESDQFDAKLRREQKQIKRL